MTDTIEQMCDGIPTLILAIQEHRRENPVAIVMDDDPYTRQLGYATADGAKRWRVRLTSLKEQAHRYQDELRALIRTAAGRQKIADLLSEGKDLSPWCELTPGEGLDYTAMMLARAKSE